MKLFTLSIVAASCLALTSCSQKDRSQRDTDKNNVSEKVADKGSDMQFSDVVVPGAEVAPIIENIQNGEAPTEAETDIIIDYLEENAPEYFRAAHTLVTGIKSLQHDQSQSNQAKLTALANSFDAQWDNYSISLQIIMNMEDEEGMLTPEQQARLSRYASQYSDGLEDFGFILGLSQMDE